MSNPPAASPETSTPAPGGTGSAASRRYAVLVHVGLMALAVVVVATTFGRDESQRASASALGGLAIGQPDAVTGIAQSHEPGHTIERDTTERVALDTSTHKNAQPADITEFVTASDSLETSPRVVIDESHARAADAPTPSRLDEPMLAIPEDGKEWPVRIKPADRDDSYAAFGSVYGLPGAQRIVYVLDASGSLVDTLPFVLTELQKALRELKSDQSYAVLFIKGDDVLEVPPVGMKKATASTVTASVQWMDPIAGNLLAGGSAVPDAALRRALAYEPDAIVLLSDSLTGRSNPLADRVRLIHLIDAANTAGSVFHTVQLHRPDPLAGETRRGTSELIALRSGGRFRYVPEAELSGDAKAR